MTNSSTGVSMAKETSKEAGRPFTVLIRRKGGNIHEWSVTAANPRQAVGDAMAHAVFRERHYGPDDLTWGDLGFEVVGVYEGHRVDLLGSKVSLWKDRGEIDAAMQAALDVIEEDAYG